MTGRIAGLVSAALFLVASAGRTQVAWDSPWLVPPEPSPGFGIFLIEPDRGDLGVLVTWRPVGARRGLGLRFGLAEGPGPDDVSGFTGADIGGPLNRASQELPLDIAWVAGAGLGFGDWVMVGLPFGLTIGRTFRGEGVAFTPYLTARIGLDGHFGRADPPGDDLELGLAVDLGVDVRFSPSLAIRFGATFGDREALAVGVVF